MDALTHARTHSVRNSRHMQHLTPISRTPLVAQEGNTSGLEQVILLLMTVIFQDWDNFLPVLQNLEKFYSKTPD